MDLVVAIVQIVVLLILLGFVSYSFILTVKNDKKNSKLCDELMENIKLDRQLTLAKMNEEKPKKKKVGRPRKGE